MNLNKTEMDLWQQAIALAQRIYILTRQFPEDERFGITQQLRETATEVACTISEDVSLSTPSIDAIMLANRQMVRLKTLLVIAEGLGFPKDEEVLPQCLKLSRLLARAIEAG